MEQNADVVVSMFGNDASILPGINDGSRTVLEIHFSRFKRQQYGRKGIWKIVDDIRSRNDLKVVSKFDRFVVLTEEDKGYWGDLQNIQVIPNARTFVFDRPAELTEKKVVAVFGPKNDRHMPEGYTNTFPRDEMGNQYDDGFSFDERE